MNLRKALIDITESIVQAKNEKFAQHPTADLVRRGLRSAIEIAVDLDTSKYKVHGSAGQGNWAEVPWVAIFRNDITDTAQIGIYPVYLFRADGSGVYLSLGFGATELRKQGLAHAKNIAEQARNTIRNAEPALTHWPITIDVTGKRDTDKGKDYEWATAGAKFYDANSMPSNEQLVSDLKELLAVYSRIDADLLKTLEPKSFSGDTQEVQVDAALSLCKPFVLLAGISGTGKTRFVRKQAETSGTLSENYELVAVRPDWHEPSDLLGYISRLSENGTEYIATDVVKFMIRAWKAIFDAGLVLESVSGKQSKHHQLVLSGTKDQLNKLKPYWLCLDEMNLAPVEQYFSDYLAIIETREWHWLDDDFEYRCDALLKPSLFADVEKNNLSKLQKQFGLEGHQELWELILQDGLSIPPNLIVAGTVNMDETTHGFSRKVIDRALSFDFGEFFPNDYQHFFEAKTEPITLTFPYWSQAEKEYLSNSVDPQGQDTIAFLNEVNTVLKHSPFELAYRALNELLLSVVAFNPQNKAELQAVWDDFLMCKVLPRIEGDVDKLQSTKDILTELEECLTKQLKDIWSDNEEREDLYRFAKDGSELNVACRSKKKLAWMKERLTYSGFTSFWP